MEEEMSFSSSDASTMPSSANYIALITGANKGIGFEVARQLGRKGIFILVGSRDSVKGNEAVKKLEDQGILAQLIDIDVTNQQTIDCAAAKVEREHGHLDILINNAAVHLEGESPSQTTMEKLRQTFETNFFGVFSVTKAFIPLLEKSSYGACIVNVSSQLGSFGNNIKDRNKLAYSCSKAALNMMTYQFAKEFQDKKMRITINSVDPGQTRTDMNQHCEKFAPVEAGAEPIVYFAMAKYDEQAILPNGQFFNSKRDICPW